jgi:hypothetical protein
VERDLRGLGERAHEDQQADRDDHPLVLRVHPRGALERARVVERPGVALKNDGGENQPHVADHVDHERLDARIGRRAAPVPEADQRVGGEAHERPADDQQHEVARQHQQQHREDEEVEVAEVARVTAISIHVGDRVDVDQEAHAGYDERHEDGQWVDEDLEPHIDAACARVVPQGRCETARVLRLLLDLDQRADRVQEREPDRG